MIRKRKRLGGKTRAGRLMKRLMGDTAGGVLMEYVVLGLLIVAAVAGAIIMFGGGIKDSLTTETSILTGQTGKAQTDAQAARDNQAAAETKAKAHRDAIIKDE